MQAAAADAAGNLWIATALGVTYVYDDSGDKIRTVQFRAAGPVSPMAMSFTPKGRLLIAPGCFAFDVGRRTEPGHPAMNGAAPARKRAAFGSTRYSQMRS